MVIGAMPGASSCACASNAPLRPRDLPADSMAWVTLWYYDAKFGLGDNRHAFDFVWHRQRTRSALAGLLTVARVLMIGMAMLQAAANACAGGKV